MFLENDLGSSLLEKQTCLVVLDCCDLKVTPPLKVHGDHVGCFWSDIVHEALHFEFGLATAVVQRGKDLGLSPSRNHLLHSLDNELVVLLLFFVVSENSERLATQRLQTEFLLDQVVHFGQLKPLQLIVPRFEAASESHQPRKRVVKHLSEFYELFQLPDGVFLFCVVDCLAFQKFLQSHLLSTDRPARFNNRFERVEQKSQPEVDSFDSIGNGCTDQVPPAI